MYKDFIGNITKPPHMEIFYWKTSILTPAVQSFNYINLKHFIIFFNEPKINIKITFDLFKFQDNSIIIIITIIIVIFLK